MGDSKDEADFIPIPPPLQVQVYPALLEKIGLLDEAQVEATISAYADVSTTHWMIEAAAEKDEALGLNVLRRAAFPPVIMSAMTLNAKVEEAVRVLHGPSGGPTARTSDPARPVQKS
jgi:hypothetical protein